MPFGGEEPGCEVKPGGHVPGRQYVIDRSASRSRHQREAACRVDRVIDRGRAVAIADQAQHDQIVALGLQGGEVEPAQRRQVGQHDAAPGPGGGRQRAGDLAPLGLVEGERQRPLALVEPGPIKAGAVPCHRPAGMVDAAADRVDADHLRPHLRHRHAAQWGRDKGRNLDDAQILKQPVHALPPDAKNVTRLILRRVARASHNGIPVDPVGFESPNPVRLRVGDASAVTARRRRRGCRSAAAPEGWSRSRPASSTRQRR